MWLRKGSYDCATESRNKSQSSTLVFHMYIDHIIWKYYGNIKYLQLWAYCRGISFWFGLIELLCFSVDGRQKWISRTGLFYTMISISLDREVPASVMAGRVRRRENEISVQPNLVRLAQPQPQESEASSQSSGLKNRFLHPFLWEDDPACLPFLVSLDIYGCRDFQGEGNE